ncbi:hypothetical protein B0H15DRAFT_855066, partial [Mycena belliarum]
MATKGLAKAWLWRVYSSILVLSRGTSYGPSHHTRNDKDLTKKGEKCDGPRKSSLMGAVLRVAGKSSGENRYLAEI